jgi:hypothetical protein
MDPSHARTTRIRTQSSPLSALKTEILAMLSKLNRVLDAFASVTLISLALYVALATAGLQA